MMRAIESMCKSFQLLFVVLLLLLPSVALCHEIRPAYLKIEQTSANQYEVMWKVPRNGDMNLKIYPLFSKQFTLKQVGDARPVTSAMIFHYQLTGRDALIGTDLTIDNLAKTKVDVLVTMSLLTGDNTTFILRPDESSITIPGITSKWQVIKTYTILGVEHIWFGMDHLLFVLALILITVGFKKLIKTITAFTLAHSITLSLAVLGFVHIPIAPVEAIIALSIVFLAAEISKVYNGKPSLTAQKPWLVAFIFGLLHGLGFASAISEVGLPQSEIPLALAFFNIGVELGQIAFVIVVLGLIRLLTLKKNWPVVVQKIPAYVIGTIAMFWTIERILGFWGK